MVPEGTALELAGRAVARNARNVGVADDAQHVERWLQELDQCYSISPHREARLVVVHTNVDGCVCRSLDRRCP